MSSPKDDFLARHGWHILQDIAQDSSSRSYGRVQRGDHTAILMQDHSGDTDQIQRFMQIGKWLSDIGLSTPQIYEVDEGAGLLLLEDFGDTSFKTAIENGVPPGELYALARDVLSHMTSHPCPLDLPGYKGSRVDQGHRRIMDWYLPAALGRQVTDEELAEYHALWRQIEAAAPPAFYTFQHIDFHVENLMFLPERDGVKQAGILDFQDAMFGPKPYDLGNLLEDPRCEITEDLRQNLLADLDDAQKHTYRIVTTQFHMRVTGQFIKLAIRDNKTRYLAFLPRLETYIRAALQDPALKPLQSFFTQINLDFDAAHTFNIAAIESILREDAF